MTARRDLVACAVAAGKKALKYKQQVYVVVTKKTLAVFKNFDDALNHVNEKEGVDSYLRFGPTYWTLYRGKTYVGEIGKRPIYI